MTSKKGCSFENLKMVKNSNKRASNTSETSSPYFLPSRKQNKNFKSNKFVLLKNENERTTFEGEDKKKNCKTEVLETKIDPVKWEPSNWKVILANIRIMRSQEPAPVDMMGCHRCADENITEKERRFTFLLALMLSTRTKDEITYAVMGKLKREINPLSPANILQKEAKDLEQLLKPVAFYRNKANFIVRTSKILIEKYDSDIPETADGLMNLPGVSSKIAHICMSVAWNVVTGIGVDTHVHRISNRLKWVKKETKTPEKTRVELESWTPKNLWSDLNLLLVGFGQTICKAINPLCDSCLNKEICPYNSANNNKTKVKINIEW